MTTDLLDARSALSAPEGMVIRDARGMVFEKIGSDLWGSTREEWGALSSDIAFPATILLDPFADLANEEASPYGTTCPAIPAQAVEGDDPDRGQWIARMTVLVEKLGIQQGIHDYALEMKARNERPTDVV